MQFKKLMLIAQVLGLILLPSSAFALQSGDFTYTETGGTIYITKYTGAGGAVEIPETIDSKPVVIIGSWAFENCTGLTSVTIPSSVTSIDAYAFYGCTGLTSVTIESGVTRIAEWAFENCTGLTSITIPSSVTSIGNYAFKNCTGLTSINIPSSAVIIGNYAFQNCTGLTSVTISEGLAGIGDGAFYGCTGLTSINIPSSITSIDAYAFYGCSGLTSAYFCGNAPTMGKEFVDVEFPYSPSFAPQSVFDNCASDFTVYYPFLSIGFTWPWWYGYPTKTYGLCPATKVLGKDNPELENLRYFRDNRLAQSALGRKIIEIYYNNADSINGALEYSQALREATRQVLEIIALMVGNN